MSSSLSLAIMYPQRQSWELIWPQWKLFLSKIIWRAQLPTSCIIGATLLLASICNMEKIPSPHILGEFFFFTILIMNWERWTKMCMRQHVWWCDYFFLPTIQSFLITGLLVWKVNVSFSRPSLFLTVNCRQQASTQAICSSRTCNALWILLDTCWRCSKVRPWRRERNI